DDGDVLCPFFARDLNETLDLLEARRTDMNHDALALKDLEAEAGEATALVVAQRGELAGGAENKGTIHTGLGAFFEDGSVALLRDETIVTECDGNGGEDDGPGRRHSQGSFSTELD